MNHEKGFFSYCVLNLLHRFHCMSWNRWALKVIAISDTAKVITDFHLEHWENIWINSDQIRRLNGIQSEPWSRILRKQCIPDRIAGSHWTWRPPLHSPWYTTVPQYGKARHSIFYLHWYSSSTLCSPCIPGTTTVYYSTPFHHAFPYNTIFCLLYYIHWYSTTTWYFSILSHISPYLTSLTVLPET